MLKRLAAALALSVVITSVPVFAEEIPAEDAQIIESDEERAEREMAEKARPDLAAVTSIPDGYRDVFVPKSVSDIDAPKGAVFESSDEEIARVGSKSGIIKVLKPGNFSITMTIGDSSVVFNYLVEKPKAIEKEITLSYLTQSYYLPDNVSGNDHTAPTAFWSSCEDVAIVDDTGRVTAVGNGTAMIFTYFGKHIVKTRITVDAGDYDGPILPVAINSKVSILGDSWSAFAPDVKAYYRHDYYYGNEFTQNDMWWGGLNIEKNNSIGGSGVICQPQALNSRENDLGSNPGTIIVQLGANDKIFGCWSKDNYDQMLKNIKAAYPNALVFCGTYANIGNGDSGSLNTDIKEAAAANDCYIIDNDSLTLSFFTDYIHPDPAGMATLKENMQKVISKYLPGGENDIINQKMAEASRHNDEDDSDDEEAEEIAEEEAKDLSSDNGKVDTID